MIDASELAKKYFDYFTNKNIEGLQSEIYADDVHLKDWTGEWFGKQSVLDMNSELFKNEFTIDIHKIIRNESSAVVIFQIIINNDILLNVCDVLEWNDEGKLKAINAYKQRSDRLRIGIIAMARSGGRNLGAWIASETGYKFIHEPLNNKIEVDAKNSLVVKWLVGEWKLPQMDKWIGLYRNDYRSAAISNVKALETGVWHDKYKITDKWIKQNETKIKKFELQMQNDIEILKSIPEIELMVTYEGIYNTGEDIPKLLNYLGIDKPKYLQLLDGSNRLRITENNKQKKLM